jgi:hypothetical protein
MDDQTQEATAAAEPAPAPPRRPDAVLCHENYPAGVAEYDRPGRLQREFGPVLGIERVWCLHVVPDHATLCVGNPAEHRYHAKGGPLEGRDRYTWERRPGDGPPVYLGYLTPEAQAEPPGLRQAADAMDSFTA